MRSFIKPDLFDNNVPLPFNSTTPIYLITLLWKLGLDLELHYISIFHGE